MNTTVCGITAVAMFEVVSCYWALLRHFDVLALLIGWEGPYDFQVISVRFKLRSVAVRLEINCVGAGEEFLFERTDLLVFHFEL